MYSAWSIVVYAILSLFYSGFIYAEMRDPTEPSSFVPEKLENKEAESVSSFVLDAILISEDSKFAIINNDIVKIGDMIGNHKVKSIDSYSVTLVGGQGEVVLRLFGSPIKEPTK